MQTTLVAVSIRFLAAAIFAAMVTPVYAQSNEVIATVPFEFVVGAQHLPAGKYMLRPLSDDPSVVTIENMDGRGAAIALTIPAAEPNRFEIGDSTPTLTFAARGTEHVLAAVVEADGSQRAIIGAHAANEPAAAAEPAR